MNIIRVGVDIAKSVFHVHGVDRYGKTVWQAKYARAKWLNALESQGAGRLSNRYRSLCISPSLGTRAEKLGYHVRLIPGSIR